MRRNYTSWRFSPVFSNVIALHLIHDERWRTLFLNKHSQQWRLSFRNFIIMRKEEEISIFGHTQNVSILSNEMLQFDLKVKRFSRVQYFSCYKQSKVKSIWYLSLEYWKTNITHGVFNCLVDVFHRYL